MNSAPIESPAYMPGASVFFARTTVAPIASTRKGMGALAPQLPTERKYARIRGGWYFDSFARTNPLGERPENVAKHS